MQQNPVPVPWPLSTFPGANPQESAGRLINCCSEPLGEPGRPTGPSPQKYIRQPGLTLFAAAAGQTGSYRGGLLVNNSCFECWANQVYTVDNATPPNVALFGAFPGTRHVSIARNQASPIDVIAVDPDNGAWRFSGGGAPAIFTGGGVLPQPNSVSWQDSYFFFTIGDNRVFASGVNSIVINALTFITVQKKSDVQLLRGIAYSGLMWFFTTGHCEVWSNTAQPFPGFPYSYLATVNQGLLQTNAIAGFETGFDQLFWVSQDFGVYWARGGNTQPEKVSSPDLDRLIQQQHTLGNQLVAGCYTFGGKKFWTLSSPAWTWELNLNTMKWNERTSLNLGLYGRWRADGGHPAFGKWLTGDTRAANLMFIDPTNFTENGDPMLFRMESGPVPIGAFPTGVRICRFDANFDMGVGINVNNYRMPILGAVAGTGGVIRLTVPNTAQVRANDTVLVSGVTGTTEANGTWLIRIVDLTHIELLASVFVNAYVAGGTAIDVTSQPNAVQPKVAISISIDGGMTWGNPLVRELGAQGKTKRTRATAKNLGRSPPLGARYRLDITDEVYVGFLGATQSSSPLEPGFG